MGRKAKQEPLRVDVTGLPAAPHDDEIEKAILGACLVGDDLRDTVLSVLNEEDFWTARNQRIFEAIKACSTKGIPSELNAVAKEMGSWESIRAANDDAYLFSLVSCAASDNSLDWHCQQLRELSNLRALGRAAMETLAMVYRSTESRATAAEVAERMERAAELRTRSVANEIVPLVSAVRQAAERLEERRLTGQETVGLPTGFPPLDRKVGGLRAGELTLLAGRPGMGKTTLALNMILSQDHEDTGILWVTPEVSRENIADKTVANLAAINALRMRSGCPSEGLVDMARAVAEQVEYRRVWIYDAPSPTVPQILEVLRGLKRKNTIRLVVIDHLLRLSTTLDDESAERRIADVVRQLGTLAKRESVHVLLLSQLNRLCEGRADKRPMLSDLQGSGSTEQDADHVWFCYREEYYAKDKCPASKRNTLELIVEKARYGETGTIMMQCDLALGRIAPLAHLS